MSVDLFNARPNPIKGMRFLGPALGQQGLPPPVFSEDMSLEQLLLSCDTVCGQLQAIMLDKDVLSAKYAGTQEGTAAVGIALTKVGGRVVIKEVVQGGVPSCLLNF
jgi:hypothetical protein